ncbi:acetyltransferase [Naegleria gruberi]|uniref:Acetyltransferase n=1 Tax=Naegleria gruberi TaxID=5762 RepID=D2VLZ4_NAEGR|nr:acetyltransferase [Naegleria gruberi]EFC42229.1 acetyltransferase [Naegleria gruberi]|eukprot:XP_002674973.1 acetyltransferase [Naegleria gruberi strain NEG-M]
MSVGEITILPLNDDLTLDMAQINGIVLPVNFSAKIYSQMVQDKYSFVAFVKNPKTGKDEAVGAIGCVLKSDPHACPNTSGLCIASLAVLAKYRSKGIGSKLLNQVIELVECQKKLITVYLQTQVNNDDGIKFYQRHNFSIITRIEKFYRRLDPPDCFVLSRCFH